jgi:quinoprotein glucose dehydrogenase
MEIPQPFWNHNSGNMLFGPDGFLYIAVGDGGKADDVTRLAQNRFVFNGKILRIDVDGRDGDLQYAIPPDNPFARTEGVRPEIYALGLRNPWGIHIDDQGRFWCADVGQDLFEEIDLIVPGGNYGWSFREGKHAFAKRKDPPTPDAGFIEPIHEYSRGDGLSITGGVVYRGKANPSLQGYYLYGDWRFGTLWALKTDGETATENHVLRKATPEGTFKPSAFCEDLDREVFVLSWDGKIYKIK